MIAGSRTMPPTSPARSIPVWLPNPNRVHVEWRIADAVRVFLSSAERDLRRDDVARVGDRVLERHPAHGLVVGVVDVGPAAVELEDARCP